MDEKLIIALGFLVFVTLAYYYLRVKVSQGLDNKINLIRNEIEKYRELHQNAELVLKNSNNKLEEVKKQGLTLASDAESFSEKLVKDKMNKLDELMKRKKIEIEKTISNEKQIAKKEIYDYFFSVSEKIAINYIEDLSKRDDKKIVKILACEKNNKPRVY